MYDGRRRDRTFDVLAKKSSARAVCDPAGREVRPPGMPSSARHLLAGAALAAAAAIPRVALADDGVAVRLDYSVARGCPDGAAFFDRMAARTPRVRVARPGEEARELVVRVTGHGRRVQGQIAVRAPDGTEATRTVTGETCGDVVTGLALIAALAIDPTADASPTATPPTPAAAAAPTHNTSSTTPAAAPAPAAPVSSDATREPEKEADREAPRDEAADHAEPDAAREAGAHEATAPGGRWEASFGAQGAIVSGAAPDALLTIPVFAEIARPVGGVLRPAARLRFERAGTGVPSGGPGAQFTWTAVSLDLCPLGLDEGPFLVRVCARGEAGALAATGVNVQPARSESRPWMSVGPVARARWAPVSVLVVEVEAGAPMPAVRDRFFVEPSTTVFRAPALGWTVAVGAGVLFR
jgi:hypothetical protein